jgi:hypothetical protein
MKKTIILLLLALSILTPSALASHTDTVQQCRSSDCPLWARGAGYNTHTYVNSNSYNTNRNYWYDDAPVKYVFHDVYHPPKQYYVHYNDNYRNHYNQYRGYRYTRYNQYATRQIIYRGDGFTRYY